MRMKWALKRNLVAHCRDIGAEENNKLPVMYIGSKALQSLIMNDNKMAQVIQEKIMIYFIM